MENRPMTYISQKDIFQFLSLETRRKLASRHPEFRQIHQKLPFSLKIVSFEYLEDDFGWWNYHKITLDGLTWEIRRKNVFGAESREMKVITLPSGRKVQVKCENVFKEWVPRFMKYYLARKRTRFQKFIVKNFDFHYGYFNLIKIHQLYISHYHVNLLKSLKNSHFRKCLLSGNGALEKMNTHKITTDFLILKANSSSLPKIQGITEKVHVLNDSSYEDGFDVTCEELQRTSDEEFPIGCLYRGIFSDLNEDADGFLEGERNEYNGEYKYNMGRSGVCLEVSGDRELFLAAYNEELDPGDWHRGTLTFQFEMLKKGTTLFYHELPVALQEKYQSLVAKQSQLMERSREQDDQDISDEEEVVQEENPQKDTSKTVLYALCIVGLLVFVGIVVFIFFFCDLSNLWDSFIVGKHLKN